MAMLKYRHRSQKGHMSSLTSLRHSLAFILIYAGIGIAVFALHNLANEFLAQFAFSVRSQAIDGCTTTSRNTFTSTTGTQTNVITDLNQTVFNQCLELKHIK